MRRIVASGVMAALFMGFSGCGGDADLGIPETPTAPKESLDMTTKIGKMKDAMKAPKPAPPKE